MRTEGRPELISTHTLQLVHVHAADLLCSALMYTLVALSQIVHRCFEPVLAFFFFFDGQLPTGGRDLMENISSLEQQRRTRT